MSVLLLMRRHVPKHILKMNGAMKNGENDVKTTSLCYKCDPQLLTFNLNIILDILIYYISQVLRQHGMVITVSCMLLELCARGIYTGGQ